jgi:hypothetical protein
MICFLNLNCVDFLLLKGQSHDQVCYCKILWWYAVERSSLPQHFANHGKPFYIENPLV